jgi:arginyl-tRNA synthetase
MNVFEIFADRINAAVRRVTSESLGVADPDTSRIVVEPPREAAHGELSTNAAMVLAKPLGAKPRELAEAIAQTLRLEADITSVEVAGPGFINVTLTADFWRRFLVSLLTLGTDYGRSGQGGGEPVNVEYVSANPTGPLHVGHCRGAVLGDAIASLLDAAGYTVTREFYINDAGAQVDALARSAFLRYREALGEDIGEIPDGLYPGDYLKEVGVALSVLHGHDLLNYPEERWLPIARDAAVAAMMRLIRDDLATVGIRHDVFFSERSLSDGKDRVAEAIRSLAEKGLVYVGRLPPPKGQPDEDWEDREQTLFRSTQFGDDVDRPLTKSDGTYTYFAGDIAYHYDKYLRGFNNMVDVLGADHSGYVKRIKASVTGLSDSKANVDIKICQLVKLLRGGEPAKMSKRAGDFVTLRDVVDEVGSDPVRFMMIYRKSEAPLDFDFEKVTEQSKENPVFYVQYAHARICSVFRQAAAEGPDLGSGFLADLAGGRVDANYLEPLKDPGELGIIRRLADYPRIIDGAVATREPHRLAFYLYELAGDFHAQWNRGKESPELRFVNHRQVTLTKARLALIHAVKSVLSSGLAILGVQAPEEMR